MAFYTQEEIKIPQNDKSFFKIERHENWKYAIKIKYVYTEEVNYFNLFLILKSYVLNTSFPPYAVCVSFIHQDKKEVVSEKSDIRWIKGVDFYGFVDWINFVSEKMSKYERSDDFNGIIILFSKSLCEMYQLENLDNNFLEKLKPNYPWEPDFINNFSDQIDSIKILKEKINYYEKIFKNKKI